MTTVKQHKKEIPDFKNRQEMAEWFDTHDTADYGFKPVKVKFELDKPKEDIMIVRINKGVKEGLKRIAQEKGLNTSSLVRMWIMEKFNQAHK